MRGRYIGYAREDCWESGRSTNDLLKHEGLIDLLPEHQVLVLQTVFQALIFFEGLFQFGPGLRDFAISRRVLHRYGDLASNLAEKVQLLLGEGIVSEPAEIQGANRAISANQR